MGDKQNQRVQLWFHASLKVDFQGLRLSLVERSVESPDTLSGDCSLTNQRSYFFNQLPRSRLERVLGSRSAPFPDVEGDQMLEERRTMKGCRSLTVALVFLAISSATRPSYARGPASTSTVPITATVTVLGRKSAEPPTITKHDVTVYSGKTRLNIKSWVPAQNEKPGLQLAIVIDNSASQVEIGSQLGSLADFIGSQPKNTAVGIFYAVNGTVETASAFSTDHAAVAKTLRLPLGLRAGASPSVYESISDLVNHHWPSTGGSREVLLISSGVDYLNQGPESPYVQATIEDMQKAGVVIHTIYTGGRLSFDESLRGQNAQDNLVKITDASGGYGFFEGIAAPVRSALFLAIE